ncbi:MAG: hypothetical protein NWF00_05250 [Candidatus Bathyarchaeota archaeon]|nr:hypothetical protein [Candidatus Bathyarchaeota archaeon]
MKEKINKQELNKTNAQRLDRITDILANLLKSNLAPEHDLMVLEAQELALSVRDDLENSVVPV